MSDLGELEDLYYATCAKLKERLDDVNIRLSNGFIRPEDNYFTYNSKGCGIIDPVTAGEWKATLLAHAAFLYDPLVEGIMSRAVFLKHKRAKEAESAQRLPLNGKFPGLRDVRNMSSGMIFGGLSEKYRITVHQEELEKEQAAQFRKARLPARRQHTLSEKEGRDRISGATIPIVHSYNNQDKAARVNKKSDSTRATTQYSNDQHEATPGYELNDSEVLKAQQYDESADPPQRYISPYNLDERAKKLNQPGGPEMPCICDPECMCAPLCASDPAQNCFCEENALFCRVTEGMDIDDLSYPTKAVEEEEAVRAGKEYMAQLMAMDNSQQDTLKTSSTVEPYSTLEPVVTLGAPTEDMEVDHPTFPTHELLPNGQIDIAAILRKNCFGGSLSIWAKESPNGGERYRDLSSHWHDDLRATVEAHRRSVGPDPDFYYPHFSPYGRLDLQRINEQCPTPSQRLLKLTRGSLRSNKGLPKMVNAPGFPRSNTDNSGPVVKQEKPKSKTSLFANRLIGRSSQTSPTAPKSQILQSGRRNITPVDTAKALPRLPK